MHRGFRWSAALYRALIRAYPRPFRDRFAEDMIDDFVSLCDAHTRRAGPIAGRLQAWRCALADLGVSVTREQHFMIREDLRFAVRRLRRAPGFTLACVLTLGLGIGGTTAVYSVLQAVVLRDLPFLDPDRLVRFYEITPQGADFSASEANFVDFRARLRTIDQLAAYSESNMTLLGHGDAEALAVANSSHALFALTGARTLIGRTFLEDEDRPGGHTRVVVLSHSIWQRRFGSDRAIVGRRLLLDGTPHEVVGVMAPGFDFPAGTDGWVPLVAHPRAPRTNHLLRVIGRLRPGVSLDDAQADSRAVAQSLAQEYPKTNAGWSARVDTFSTWLIGPSITRTLFVLLGAAALLLVVACANVANLVTIRATARRRELAMLVALGAGRLQVVRGLFVESLLLALTGGALGVLVAYLGVPLLRRLAPTSVPRLDEAAVDGTVLLVALAVSIGVGVAFGLLPALFQARTNPQDCLRDGRAASGSPARRRLREALVAGELALAMMLLVGAALLVDSFRRLQTLDVGFDGTHVLAVHVSLTGGPYATCIPALQPDCDPKAVGRRRTQFIMDAAERLRSLPGVTAAGATSVSPLAGGGTATEFMPDGYASRGEDDVPFADWRAVTDGLARTLTVPIVRGRTFTPDEVRAGAAVVIVSETLARQYWPGENPVGRRLSMGKRAANWLTIVGVARDARDTVRARDPRPTVWLPYGMFPWPFMTILVKTQGPIDGMAAAIRRDLRAIEGTIPIPDSYPLAHDLDRSMAAPRFSMLLMGLFAGTALVLAGLGVYGVTAYAVALRTREIGVRMALGAEPRQMVLLIAGRGLLLALAGIAAGSAGAFLLSGFVESLLFETRAADLRSHAVVAATLVLVTAAAIVVPAWRASRIDPRQALIAE